MSDVLAPVSSSALNVAPAIASSMNGALTLVGVPILNSEGAAIAAVSPVSASAAGAATGGLPRFPVGTGTHALYDRLGHN